MNVWDDNFVETLSLKFIDLRKKLQNLLLQNIKNRNVSIFLVLISKLYFQNPF